MNRLTISTVFAVLFLGGCVEEDGRIYPPDPLGHAVFSALYGATAPVVYEPREYVVTSPAPSVRYERVLPAPGYADAVWVPGYWGWSNGWGWSSGYWTHRPYYRSTWIAPRYYYRGGRHYWRSGYWTR